MKNKSIISLLFIALLCACSSPSYIVKAKKNSFDFNMNTEENIPVKVNILIGDGIIAPAQPVTNYQLSYAITNLSETKTLRGFVENENGQRRTAFLSVKILLSDGTIMENRANLVFVNQVSPKVTSSYQYLQAQVPKGKTISNIQAAEIFYETQNIPSIKIEK